MHHFFGSTNVGQERDTLPTFAHEVCQGDLRDGLAAGYRPNELQQLQDRQLVLLQLLRTLLQSPACMHQQAYLGPSSLELS